MDRYLIYNFSGEIDDLSHLFPNERLAQLAAIIRAEGAEAEVWDRGNVDVMEELAPARWKRSVAGFAGERLFRTIAQNGGPNPLEKAVYGTPLKVVSGSMEKEVERNYDDFMHREARRIAEGGFDAVILNLWQGGFGHSMRLAELVKEAADIPVYGTGQRVDWFQQHILRHYSQLDGIILGLGYGTVRRLARGEPFGELPNVAYMNGRATPECTERRVTKVDALPMPDYSPEVYRGIEGLIPLAHVALSNQACPNRCAFCPRPTNYGRVVRRKPVEHAVQEVAKLCEQGFRHFRIADSTPPPGQLTDFADGIIRHRLHERDIRITAFSRIDQNRDEDFELLRRAGFEALFFGLETLDDKGLRRIRKGITYEDIRHTLRRAHDEGFFVVGSLIFPLPGETADSRETTFARLRELEPWLDSVLIQPAGVYPSSPWGRNPEEFDIHLEDDYIARLMDYPVKLIIPMRFWPPFPFSYPIMGKPAAEVSFEDIRTAFESFARRVWRELDVSNVQDYALLVADMLDEEPRAFADHVKRVLITRDYDDLARIMARTRRALQPA
ncbi:MAG: radical SAM protein [Candidatus Brocadiia bacterium]